ncbi:MAG: acetyl-CoA carboxylase biotin carboxyl carrier protein [Flavobacteriales bacterium]|nr:acetyl-CoA carboxylase biotin carboxyl carrier protein [Flavobacteriales bacterium]
MKLSEIQELIKFVAKSGVTEVELEHKDFKIVIKTPPGKRRGQKDIPEILIQAAPAIDAVGVAPAPVAVSPVAVSPVPVATTAAPTADEEKNSEYIIIKAPMIGTFYRASDPEKPPFINVGDNIAEGDTICIIEAMKLFNEIESEVTGKVVKILADDTSPVQYDQPLFLIDPNA